MEERIRNEECRAKILCVDSYEQGVIMGRLYNANYEGEGSEFHSMVQLLLEMEHRLDEINYPQSFTKLRSFVPVSKNSTEGRRYDRNERGTIGTFIVKVLFRQHSSWQGTISWIEGQSEQTFRSVLELIVLLDSALSEKQ